LLPITDALGLDSVFDPGNSVGLTSFTGAPNKLPSLAV
jgi:hypothetical protein